MKHKNDKCVKCGHKRNEHQIITHWSDKPYYNGDAGQCYKYIKKGKAIYDCNCKRFIDESSQKTKITQTKENVTKNENN